MVTMSHVIEHISAVYMNSSLRLNTKSYIEPLTVPDQSKMEQIMEIEECSMLHFDNHCSHLLKKKVLI